MPDVGLLDRIAARRGELDVLEGKLVARLAEVRAEREELAVAEKVLTRFADQDTASLEAAMPASAQVGGRAVLVVPHRAAGMTATALPADYKKILAFVEQAVGPVTARVVGEGLGLDLSGASRLEPLRAKLIKLAERGWLQKLPGGRFARRS